MAPTSLDDQLLQGLDDDFFFGVPLPDPSPFKSKLFIQATKICKASPPLPLLPGSDHDAAPFLRESKNW